MEKKKNYILCFLAVNLHKKTTLGLMKILLALNKKSVEVLDEIQDTILKGRKVNKFRWKLFDPHYNLIQKLG